MFNEFRERMAIVERVGLIGGEAVVSMRVRSLPGMR